MLSASEKGKSNCLYAFALFLNGKINQTLIKMVICRRLGGQSEGEREKLDLTSLNVLHFVDWTLEQAYVLNNYKTKFSKDGFKMTFLKMESK